MNERTSERPNRWASACPTSYTRVITRSAHVCAGLPCISYYYLTHHKLPVRKCHAAHTQHTMQQQQQATVTATSNPAGSAVATAVAASPLTPAPTGRTELRPVKYHYADTFWCTYAVSVVSANIAELGEWNRECRLQSVRFNVWFQIHSHLPARPHQDAPADPGRGDDQSRRRCGHIEHEEQHRGGGRRKGE